MGRPSSPPRVLGDTGCSPGALGRAGAPPAAAINPLPGASARLDLQQPSLQQMQQLLQARRGKTEELGGGGKATRGFSEKIWLDLGRGKPCLPCSSPPSFLYPAPKKKISALPVMKNKASLRYICIFLLFILFFFFSGKDACAKAGAASELSPAPPPPLLLLRPRRKTSGEEEREQGRKTCRSLRRRLGSAHIGRGLGEKKGARFGVTGQIWRFLGGGDGDTRAPASRVERAQGAFCGAGFQLASASALGHGLSRFVSIPGAIWGGGGGTGMAAGGSRSPSRVVLRGEVPS